MPKGHRIAWPAARRAALEEFEISPLRDQELLVQSILTLVSPGTERAFFRGDANADRPFPQYPGYSNIGLVVARGADTSHFAVGDLVASYGNHASHVVIPEQSALPVPEQLAAEEAVFFNLGAIALQGLRRARLEIGESLLTIGLGPVGQWVTRLASVSGALPNLAADPLKHRCAMAENAAGPAGRYIDAALDPRDPHFDKLLHDRIAEGADVVIEASGAPTAPVAAFRCAAEGGRVVLLGGTRGETPHVDFYRDVHRKGLSVLGAHLGNRPAHDSAPGKWAWHRDACTVLALLAAGKIRIGDLCSLSVSPAQAPAMYDRLCDGGDDLIGVTIDWRQL